MAINQHGNYIYIMQIPYRRLKGQSVKCQQPKRSMIKSQKGHMSKCQQPNVKKMKKIIAKMVIDQHDNKQHMEGGLKLRQIHSNKKEQIKST